MANAGNIKGTKVASGATMYAPDADHPLEFRTGMEPKPVPDSMPKSNRSTGVKPISQPTGEPFDAR